jgi:alkylhydroperoxidase family enzyme
LPDRFRLAVEVANALNNDPGGLADDVRRDLLATFTPAQVVELLLTASLASGFSKAAVTWGPPPEMPTTEVPTPTPNPADRYRADQT